MTYRISSAKLRAMGGLTALAGGRMPTEHEEQRAVIQWAHVHGRAWPELDLLFAIPNGTYTASVKARKKAVAEGVRKGVPDLFLPVARGGKHGLFIEMKRRKGGSLEPEQRQWLTWLAAQGYATHRCNGSDEAIQVISDYLNEMGDAA